MSRACSYSLSFAALLASVLAVHGEDVKKPRTDLYGDPLPSGSVVRLGTIRLRHAGAEVAFSKDGKHLISCDNSGTVRVWDAATGKLQKEHRLSLGAEPVLFESAVLSPDGATAAMTDGNTVYLCDTSTGKERGRLPSAGGGLRAFSPDSKRLATQTPGKGREFHIHVWDVAAVKKRQTLNTLPNFELSKVAFSWDGRWMAGIARRRGGGLGEVWFDLFLWDVANGKLISQQVDLRHVNEDTLTFSPDGKTLAVGCRSEVGVRLLEAPTLKQKALLKSPDKVPVLDFVAVAYSPDGRRLAASYSDSQFRSPPSGGVLLWDLGGDKKARRLPARYGSRLAFAPNGETLACQEGAEVRLFDAASGRPLHHRPGHNQAGLVLAVSPDGKILVSGDSDGVLRLWDTATSKQLRMLEGDGLEVAACLFSADGKRLVSVSKADHTLLGSMAAVFFDETAAFQVWEVATGKALQRIKLRIKDDGFLLHAPGISADGRRLATLAGSVGGRVLPSRLIVWDLDTGKRRSQRPHQVEMRDGAGDDSHRSWIAAHTAFAPDGERVTTWLGDRAGIEEVATGCLLATLPKGVGQSLVFSPDGRLLAAALLQPRKDPAEGVEVAGLALIESASGEEVLRLETKEFDGLLFMPDGRGVVVTDNTCLSVWDTETGTKLHQRPRSERLARTTSETSHRVVNSLAALPGGRVAMGTVEGDILIWDLAPSTWPVRKPVGKLSRRKLDALWTDLAGDARKAHRAVYLLAASPGQSLPFLKNRLRPAAVDTHRVEKLLVDLDSESFMAREAAVRELTRLHYRVEPMLRRALQSKPSLEMRRRLETILAGPKRPLPEDLRTLRAITVLERISTSEARGVLEKLSNGALSPEARAAQAALQRLKRRETWTKGRSSP